MIKNVDLATKAFENIVEIDADSCTKPFEMLHRERKECEKRTELDRKIH